MAESKEPAGTGEVTAEVWDPPPKPGKSSAEVSGNKSGILASLNSTKGLVLAFATVSLIVGTGVGVALGSGDASANVAATAPTPTTPTTPTPTTPTTPTPTTPTTPTPTTPLAPPLAAEALVRNAVFCPVVWDENKTTTGTAACYEAGCNGTLHFCELDDDRRYKVTIALAGDYGSANEKAYLKIIDYKTTATLYTRTGSGDCEELSEVLDATTFPREGNLTVVYNNTKRVSATCDGSHRDWASKVRVTITDVTVVVS